MDKIHEIYSGYKDVVERFGEGKIQKRFMDLSQIYKEFLVKENLTGTVKVNSFMLIHAIMDYFTDISRLKDFHNIDFTNTYKTKAYEISWLLRRKPLQVMEDGHEELVYINEEFILSYAISFITTNKENLEFQDLSQVRLQCFNGFIESFYYHLKYRNCSAQALELALLSFEAGLMLNPNLSEGTSTEG